MARGQSPAHIIAANPGAIPFGVRFLYNYLGGAKAGDLTKLDLPRAVRYKPRSKSKAPGASAIPREDLEGGDGQTSAPSTRPIATTRWRWTPSSAGRARTSSAS